MAGAATLAGRRPAWPYSADQATVLVLLVVPLTFLGGSSVFGFLLSGWAWLILLVALVPLVLSLPLHPRAVSLLLPYLMFLAYGFVLLSGSTGELDTLAQFAVPALVYLVVWHTDQPAVGRRLVRVAHFGIACAAAFFFLEEAFGGIGPFDLSKRPLGLSLAVLFLVASRSSRSFPRTAGLGLACAAIALLTASRTASFVIILLILASPKLNVGLLRRALIVVLAAVAIVTLSETDAFRERFFFDDQATLHDVVTLDPRLNTAGRRELWPKLVHRCSEAPLFGQGIGTAGRLSSSLTDRAMTHPHNDYLRMWCDTGWVGSSLFWAFFALALLRSTKKAVWRRDATAATAALGVVALLLFAVTDNPVVYTAQFMAPVMMLIGLADSRVATAGEQRVGAPHLPSRSASSKNPESRR